MANTVDAFFQTLVAEVSRASQLLTPTWNASQRIFWDYNPHETGAIGKTINVAIPVDPSNKVQNIGIGDVQLSDIAFTNTPIVFDKHPQFAYPVRSFEQFNSPENISRIFVTPAFAAVKNYINASVCALFNTTNFTTNTAVSATASLPTVTQFTKAMGNLADQFVPVENNPEDMTLLLGGVPYYAMMDSSSTNGAPWTQALIAGTRVADSVRATGQFPEAFGVSIRLDQQMPVTGAAPNRTFTGALFHRFAIAGVSRPLPAPGDNVKFERVQFGDIELRVMMEYNMYPKDSWIVNIDAGYGLKVVRENMANLITIAE